MKDLIYKVGDRAYFRIDGGAQSGIIRRIDPDGYGGHNAVLEAGDSSMGHRFSGRQIGGDRYAIFNLRDLTLKPIEVM